MQFLSSFFSRAQNYRFKPSIQMTVMAVIVIVFFTRLGFWQIQRAEEKQQMMTEATQLSTQPVVPFSPHFKFKQYQLIRIQGQFLSEVFYLDNQQRQHQIGFDVLSPLLLDNGRVVLINRGWIASGHSRDELPRVVTPTKRVELVGNVYYPSTKNWTLGPNIDKKINNLFIIESIESGLIRQLLHKPVYPFIIRLRLNAEYGYLCQWPIVSMSPQRHYGYALQWFSFATVVLIIFILLNIKKKT